ncbi:hypothetical protein N9N28_00880, partial [Rubripirellula amarantea]|nr:hypothetical protein [Rubripirellula amarantea]
AFTPSPIAFPLGQITKVLQHNGEPLGWVRTLGFDAVLLRHPPDAAILAEAIRTRMKIYAPAPTTPDPSIEAMLEPVVGWYVGSNRALDSREIDETKLVSEQLRAFPSRWQRPLIAAPSESWQRYAPMFDAMIHDLPPRVRGIRGSEEVAELHGRQRWVGDRIQVAAGVNSMSPDSMVHQVESIASAIGAPMPEGFRWHSMWMQTMRALQNTPTAIIYRSSRSLASGSSIDQTRATSLSYVNRMVAMLGPWITTATPTTAPLVTGAAFQCGRLTTRGTDLLILTSSATRGNEVLAGDGNSIQIQLSPSDAAKTAWRVTNFSAERVSPVSTPTGASLEIVSPDVVEVVVLSDDPATGARLAQQCSRFARQASLDRWQLAMQSVQQTQNDWDQSIAMRANSSPRPTNLIQIARQTLENAEPMYRSGDSATSLRMARRADAWALRSGWQLAEALMPDWPILTSSPPMDMGAASVQSLWRPLMDDEGWGDNLLTAGSLDSADFIGAGRWMFGRRMAHRALSEVTHATRGSYDGPGALRASVTPIAEDEMLGGYEGTIVQIRSPSVRVPAGTAIRIDAMVRTIGFGGAHQGLLVYDTIGGQPMGVLVRGRADWTPVRLYRQTIGESEVSVMFELIGAGEVMIDEVTLRRWEPTTDTGILLRPIDSETIEISKAESTTEPRMSGLPR